MRNKSCYILKRLFNSCPKEDLIQLVSSSCCIRCRQCNLKKYLKRVKKLGNKKSNPKRIFDFNCECLISQSRMFNFSIDKY